MIRVGDVALCTPGNTGGAVDIKQQLLLIVEIHNSMSCEGINSKGEHVVCSTNELTVIVPYKDTLNAFVEKGVELCARAEKG